MMAIVTNPALRVALMMAAVVAAGCGPRRPGTLPVSGTVTIDGRALAAAAVIFQPQAGGRPATGTTDANGAFRLTTFVPRDGAIPGMHTVTIACFESPTPSEVKWNAPKYYSIADMSDLSADVRRGQTTFQFDLSSTVPPGKETPP